MDIFNLFEIIKESSQISVSTNISRTYEQQLTSTLHSTKLIKVLTGLRRSGKSFVLKKLFQQLVTTGYPRKNLLFLNFEHEQLQSYLSASGLRQLFQTFAVQIDKNQPIIAFLDEIQNVEDWHSVIRTKYDAGNINFYITGSNSKLLSGEIASKLGGRTLETHILPFNFSELLNYRGIVGREPHDIVENLDFIFAEAQNYFHFGALPECLDLETSLKRSYRQSLTEKIVINDIVKRHKLDHPEHLPSLIQYIERSLCGIVVSSNLAKAANLNDMTVTKYLRFIEETFLLYPLYKYHFQAKEILKTQRKYYLVDNLFTLNASLGGKLENLIYLELLRKYGHGRIYFARNNDGHEVDFVVFDDQEKVALAIQVSYELNQLNFLREITPLKALKSKNKHSYMSQIVYVENKLLDQGKLQNSGIHIISYADWLIHGL